MGLICDNQTDLHIVFNPVFHEIDCRFIHRKIVFGNIVTSFVNSNDQESGSSPFTEEMALSSIFNIHMTCGVKQIQRSQCILFKSFFFSKNKLGTNLSASRSRMNQISPELLHPRSPHRHFDMLPLGVSSLRSSILFPSPLICPKINYGYFKVFPKFCCSVI